MFLVLVLLTISGALVTSFCQRDKDPIFRLAFGHLVGTVAFSAITFCLALIFGFSKLTVSIGFFISCLPLVFLLRSLKDFLRDYKGIEKSWDSLVFYALLMLLMYFFFQRAIFITDEGIFTGAAHNLGDLPLHLGIIYSFVDGNNFPPENPSFAGAALTYPFMVDLVTASLMKMGGELFETFLFQNLFLIFSLVLLLDYFVFKITNNKLAGKLSVLILLFCGGFGFFMFFKDYWQDGRSLFSVLWNLQNDYTIRNEKFRWGNALTTLFITQRSLLFGFPLTLGILTYLWSFFSSSKDNIDTSEDKTYENNISILWRFKTFLLKNLESIFFGSLAGSLILIHTHSLLVLFLLCAVLFWFSLEKWKNWVLFGVSVCLIAIPEFLLIMSKSAVNTKKFIGWHFGWDKGNENIFVFWLINLGLFIPLLLISLAYVARNKETKKLIFYLPFALCFLIANTVKLAPWEWDNIKILIYWFVGSLPFVALLLAMLFESRNLVLRLIAFICMVSLCLSGALDVWRTVSGQINYDVFSKDAVEIANLIKQKTEPNALFLNAPTYNSAVVLSGRRSLMRYTGHLHSYGIDYEERARDVERIYKGGAEADALLAKYMIDYVIVSPEEYANLPLINDDYFQKFSLVAQVGAYRVYKIK